MAEDSHDDDFWERASRGAGLSPVERAELEAALDGEARRQRVAWLVRHFETDLSGVFLRNYVDEISRGGDRSAAIVNAITKTLVPFEPPIHQLVAGEGVSRADG